MTCIESLGRVYKGTNGYSKIYNPSTKKSEKAHRYIFELAFGKIPDNLVIMHTCDNRACTNLNHLVLDTQSENLKDMYRKGRQGNRKLPRGIQHHFVTLSEETIEEIKGANYSRGFYTRMAEKFNVTRQTISNIKRGKTHNYKAPDLKDLLQ